MGLPQKECCGCTACVNICKKDGIRLECDEKGFWYPRLTENCIGCKMCEQVCPIINRIEPTFLQAYAAVNKDTAVRMQSSSGGVFTILAEDILKQGGQVVATVVDENGEVRYDVCSDVAELMRFRGSKYVQSNPGAVFEYVKDALEVQKKILFVGSPCTVAGLRNYLKHDYENLLLVDFICHGVASPKIWNKYLEYQSKQLGEKPEQISFRSKKRGWNQYGMLLTYKSKEYYKSKSKDYMLRAFLSDLCLRESCYDCKFKGKERYSDITLGDFWGIGNYLREFDDDKGTSLIFVNTRKGQEIFQKNEMQMICKKVPLEWVQASNPQLNVSAPRPQKLNGFWKDVDKIEFPHLVNQYCKKSIRTMIRDMVPTGLKRKLIRILRGNAK